MFFMFMYRQLIYADRSSETSEISDTDHDCFRIHYRLVLGFPRSADSVTKTLLIAGMILSVFQVLKIYFLNLEGTPGYKTSSSLLIVNN